ncbi:MAG: DHHA1 domain-containing protein, partial [Aggregatilineales bacterium]
IELDSGLLKYAVLLVSGEGWHSGVVGIVASRLVEDYARPVIVFSESEGHLHGSARSIAGINIIAAIRSQADLLDGFGGHSMAAGMRLKTENFHLFQRGLSQTVREITQDVDLTPEIRLDAVVDFVDIDLDFAEDIARLAPFGNGNPPPVLMTENVTVKSKRKLGSRGDHLEVRLVDSAGIEQRVLWWGGDASKLPKGAFDIAYTVRANMFKGKREALIEWIDARPRTDSPVDVTERPARDIIDYRTHADPQTMLAAAREQYPDALIFAEGNKVAGGVNRFALDVSPTLIIWTVPSDASTWQAILEVTQAERLILFGNYPRFTQSQKLIQHLMGMGKFAHNQREGIVTLDNMLDHTALSINAIRAAIRWINRHSSMQFTALTEDDF